MRFLAGEVREALNAGECADWVPASLCAACGRTHYAHPDAIFAGIVPPPSPSPALNTLAGTLGRSVSPGAAPTSLTGATA